MTVETEERVALGRDGLPKCWGERERYVYGRVLAFVADAADVDIDSVTPSINIFEELKVDSLGLVLILVNLEEEFEIPRVEDDREAAKQLLTPIDIVEFALETSGTK